REAPRATSSSSRSSRCCESSSTISSSRAGSRRAFESAARTARFQSDTLGSGHAVDGGDEVVPDALPLLEDGTALGREAVVAAAALARLLDPAALDEAALLEAIEERVEGGDVEAEDAVGALLDLLVDLVAVAGAAGEEREDQQLRAAFLELTIDGVC